MRAESNSCDSCLHALWLVKAEDTDMFLSLCAGPS